MKLSHLENRDKFISALEIAPDIGQENFLSPATVNPLPVIMTDSLNFVHTPVFVNVNVREFKNI